MDRKLYRYDFAIVHTGAYVQRTVRHVHVPANSLEEAYAEVQQFAVDGAKACLSCVDVNEQVD